MKKIFPNLAKTVGPYSPAIQVNNLIFTSGQIGINSNGELVSNRVEDQAKQALNNLKTVLKAANADPKSVIKTVLYLTNINDYQKINHIYADFFADHKPARSTVAVAQLPKGAKFEIEAIAII